MSEKMWVHLDAYLQVDQEKFEEDQGQAMVDAFRQGHVYHAPIVTKPRVDPPIEMLEEMPLVPRDLVERYEDLSERLDGQLQRVTDRLKGIHQPEIEREDHPASCLVCHDIEEAEATLAYYDQVMAEMAARMDDSFFDDDAAWGPR